MYAFPNAPTMSQVANGYTWDGQKWTLPFVPDATKLNVAGGQTTTGGFRFTTYAATLTGTFTPNAYNGNYQMGSNVGAFTLAAPANECAIDLLVGNSATAGAITFSGFTVGAGKTGDALTTTNGHWFIISIRKMSGISTYVIKALQ